MKRYLDTYCKRTDFFSWTALCAFKCELNLNIFMHFSHWKSFVFECTDTSFSWHIHSIGTSFYKLYILQWEQSAQISYEWEDVLIGKMYYCRCYTCMASPLCELFHAIPANSCGETFYHNDCMWMRIPVCESLRGFVTNCCCAFGTHKIGKQMAFLCASPGDPEVCWLIQIVLGIFCI